MEVGNLRLISCLRAPAPILAHIPPRGTGDFSRVFSSEVKDIFLLNSH